MPFYPFKARRFLATAILLLTLLPGIIASGIHSPAALADSSPDLIVQDVTLSPAEPAIDDTVTITVTVKNQGAGPAGQNYLVCYADSAILATVPVNPLQAGTMSTATFTWRAEGGSHTIKATVDCTDTVPETSETNNTKTFSLTTRAADLTVPSITWTPASPSRSDAVTFTVVIKNQGNAISRTTNMNFYLDGASRGTQDVPAINPGGTITKTYTWVALVGQHAVEAVVDELNNVKESDETNNEYSATCTTAPPDLLIKSMNWSPLNLSKNDTVSINTTVKNQGTGRADACHIAYFVDGELKSTIQVNALEAGASANITFNWTVAADKHVIRAVVDHYQNVSESDETNNEWTVTISTLAPDLAVTGITWTPVNAAVGDAVTLKAAIINLGGGRSVKTHAVWIIDNAVVSSPALAEITAGSSADLSYSWVATGGSHSIRIVVDYDNLMDEPNEDNNSLSVTVNVIPPDLIIPSMSWSPADFSIDDVVTFTVTVKNQGSGRADNFNMAYFLDGSRLSVDFISRLDAGASTNRTCTWKATGGRHIFKAAADDNNSVTENDETNNENSMTIAPDMPDLAVDTVSWSPADVRPGSETHFDIAIKNLGTLSASPTRVAYYVDKAAAGYADIGQVNAGATATVKFIWSAMAGPHTFDIVADALNKITEIDETNNTKTVSFPPPDLTVQGITWAPAGAATGDKVSFAATIKNQGSGRSQSSQVICSVDGVVLATRELPEIDAAGSVTATFDWTAAAGKHRIKVTADVNNRLTESDETNNDREVDFGTLTPDLIIQAISWLMEDPLADNKVTFTIAAKNQGTSNAGAADIIYAVDKMPSVTLNLAPLAAGETASSTFSLSLETGPHTINAMIDSGGKINELDETNNTAALSFSTVVPDLNIVTITLTPAAAVPGDNVTITVKVENRGKEKAPPSKLSLSVDNVSLSTADIPQIGVGAIIYRDLSWKAAAGNHEIKAYADPDNLILESNEANNIKSRTITVEKPVVAAAPKATGLAAASAANKGFAASWWWVLLLIATVLGGLAFFSALRSFRKG